MRLLMLGLVAALLATGPAVNGDDKKDDKDKGWTPLFNGKDLTGWKVYPKGTGKWKVEDGVLIGSGNASHLFSEKGDYRNFRYRVEAKINDKGNSGQYFRAKFAKAFPPGYEAQINATHGDKIRSGSLYPDYRDNYTDAEKKKTLIFDQLIQPDEWFTQEVIAVGNHIVIKLNGKTTVDFVDEKNRHGKGHFAIQQHDPGTTIKVRKIEVAELPASK